MAKLKKIDLDEISKKADQLEKKDAILFMLGMFVAQQNEMVDTICEMVDSHNFLFKKVKDIVGVNDDNN